MMSWFRYSRAPGYLGVAVVCGGCVARACLSGDVAALSVDENPEQTWTPAEKGLTLKQAQVFFRHGARTPIHVTPNVDQASYKKEILGRRVPHTAYEYKLTGLDGGEPGWSQYQEHYNKNVLKGGCIIGQLTALGQQQMFELGTELGHCYIRKFGLLDGTFRPEEVLVRSTNIDRTIASARCVMAGIFGSPELNKRGCASICTGPIVSEVLLPNPFNCPLVQTLTHAAIIHFDNIPGIKHDRIILEQLLGIDSEHGDPKLNFIDVRDDLTARKAHGHSCPSKLASYWDMIDVNATRMIYHAMCGLHHAEKQLALRMTVGPAMTLAVEEMKAFVQGKSQHKLCLYSTHDSLILPITVVLDIYDNQWPPYGADVRIELYQDLDSEHWVRVLYCGKVQKIRGCQGTLCRYSDFLRTLSPYLIHKDEYNKVCTSNILAKIAQDLLVHEKGEKDEENRSDTPAGL